MHNNYFFFLSMSCLWLQWWICSYETLFSKSCRCYLLLLFPAFSFVADMHGFYLQYLYYYAASAENCCQWINNLVQCYLLYGTLSTTLLPQERAPLHTSIAWILLLLSTSAAFQKTHSRLASSHEQLKELTPFPPCVRT